MTKKTTVAGAYARKENYEYEGKQYEADVKNGDIVTLLNAGSVVEGQYGTQKVFSIKTRNGEKNVNMNQASENILVDEFGSDSEKWVGKDLLVLTKKDIVAGKKVIIMYLVTPDYELDEYGDIQKKLTMQSGTLNAMPMTNVSPEGVPFD